MTLVVVVTASYMMTTAIAISIAMMAIIGSSSIMFITRMVIITCQR